MYHYIYSHQEHIPELGRFLVVVVGVVVVEILVERDAREAKWGTPRQPSAHEREEISNLVAESGAPVQISKSEDFDEIVRNVGERDRE